MVTGLVAIAICLAVYSNWEDESKLGHRFSFIFEAAKLVNGLTVEFTSVVVCARASPYPTEAEVAAAQ